MKVKYLYAKIDYQQEVFQQAKMDLLNEKIKQVQSKLDTLAVQKAEADLAYNKGSQDWGDLFEIANKLAAIQIKEMQLADIDQDLDYYTKLKKELEVQLEWFESSYPFAVDQPGMVEINRLTDKIAELDELIKGLNADAHKENIQNQIDLLKSEYEEQKVSSDSSLVFSAAEATFNYLSEKNTYDKLADEINLKKQEIEFSDSWLQKVNKQVKSSLYEENVQLKEELAALESQLGQAETDLKNAEDAYKELLGL